MWILRKYGKKWIDPVSKKAWLWATYICMQKYLTYMGTFCIIQKRESRHLYTATRHIYIYIMVLNDIHTHTYADTAHTKKCTHAHN